MATEVLLVKAGMTMKEGAVAEWHVPDGGEVQAGQPLYRMETEKISLEVEAEASGIVRHAVAAGKNVAPGALIAYILAPGRVPVPVADEGRETAASPIDWRFARSRRSRPGSRTLLATGSSVLMTWPVAPSQ